jgi:hypothetical protein
LHNVEIGCSTTVKNTAQTLLSHLTSGIAFGKS